MRRQPVIRKFVVIALIAILSGSVAASPVEANSGIVKAATGIGKVVKWLFSTLPRSADEAANALKPVPKPVPAFAVMDDALANTRSATVVLDDQANVAQIYDDTGELVSAYPIEQASLSDFELFTGKITIGPLLKTSYINIKGGEFNLYKLTTKVGIGYVVLSKCNGAECVEPILSKLFRCLDGTAQVSSNRPSDDLDFTCIAQLPPVENRLDNVPRQASKR
jgi:hypothetical protein